MSTEQNENYVDLFADDIDNEPVTPEGQQPQEPTAEERERLGAPQGKSLEQLAKMYEDAQAHIQRQAAELGQIRKKLDETIVSETPKSGDDSEDDDSEFFVNPKAAISKMLENNPVLRQLQESQQKSAAEKARERVRKAHSDSAEIIASPEFAQWAQASRARQILLQQAIQNHDADVAIEVLDLYKQQAGTNLQQPDPSTGVASAGGSGSSESGGGKRFKRADIQRLMHTDPQRYKKLAPQIRQAYLEGRVD